MAAAAGPATSRKNGHVDPALASPPLRGAGGETHQSAGIARMQPHIAAEHVQRLPEAGGKVLFLAPCTSYRGIKELCWRLEWQSRCAILSRCVSEGALVRFTYPRMLMFLTVCIGGGSLVLFVYFLLFGAPRAVGIARSEFARITWDTLLCLVFFLQHSVMIRRGVKDRITQRIPAIYYPFTPSPPGSRSSLSSCCGSRATAFSSTSAVRRAGARSAWS